MSSEETIFAEALNRAGPGERDAYLAQACGDDHQLRQSVESLLDAYNRAAESQGGGLLDAPLPDLDVTADAAPAETVGSAIGPYKLIQPLGEGGMGVVYLAEQTRPVRRTVAVKIIKQGMDTRQVIARFEAERQALAVMDHPNIAKVLDAGTTEAGRPYFVMELVRGIPITDYCDQHQLTPRQRLELFLPVCHAVQHAHQKGIIHRDLKPGNVLVTLADGDRPTPKVIDFGVAKATAGQRLTAMTLVTEFRQLVGTPLYMSPEQAEMSAVMDVDTRSDVYSLGVLLYELLTGTTPFDKQRLAKAAYDEVRRIIREEEPPRPSTRLSTLGDTLTTVSAGRGTDPKRLSQTVRGELDWIVMRAIEKDRARRYGTASGLARDVERYLADESVEACPPSRIYRLRKLVRRNKAAMTTAALVAAALVLGAGVATWQAVRATRATAETLAQKQRADEQAAIAKAVNDFFNKDVIGQASAYNQGTPDVSPDRDLKVRDALDRASQRIGTQFRDQPLVEAAVRYAIGDAYHEIGEFAKAQPHLETAYRIRQQVLGERDPDTLECAANLGALYRRLGQYERAGALTGRSLEIARQSLGERHRVTLELLLASGVFELDHGHFAQAEPLVRGAAEGLQRTLGEDDRLALEALRILGSVYLGRGALDKAKPVLVRALDGHRRRLGRDHPATFETMNELAMVYDSLGDHDAAIALLLPALRGMEKAVGREYPERSSMVCNLASVYAGQGDYAEAEKLLAPLLKEQRERLGNRHADTLKVLSNLAELYIDSHQYQKAKPFAQEAWEGFRALRGDKHQHTIAALSRVAHVHAGLGEIAEAEALWQDALKASVEVHGEASKPTVVTLLSLGQVYIFREQFDLVGRSALRALAAARQCLPPDDPLIESAASMLATSYLGQQRYADAEPLLREVAALRGGKDGEALGELANVLMAQEKWAEAETVLRECLAVRQRTLPAGNYKIASAGSALGWALSMQGKYADAEPILVTAYRQLVANPPPRQEALRTAYAFERVVKLYTAWGKADEAAAWEAQRPADLPRVPKPLRTGYDRLSADGGPTTRP